MGWVFGKTLGRVGRSSFLELGFVLEMGDEPDLVGHVGRRL